MEPQQSESHKEYPSQTEQSTLSNPHLFDQSDIDYLAQYLSRTVVGEQQPAQEVKNDSEKENKDSNADQKIVPESTDQHQVKYSDKQQKKEGLNKKEMIFGGLDFRKKRVRNEKIEEESSREKAMQNQEIFSFSWKKLEQLPLYEIHNSSKQFKMYPVLSKRFELQTIFAAHYHQMEGLEPHIYFQDLALPNYTFSPEDLQQTACTVFLTAFRHLESHIKRKIRSDIVRTEGEDMADVLKMMIRIKQWSCKKNVQTWLQFILFAYNLNDNPGQNASVKELYVYIQANANNQQYRITCKGQQLEDESQEYNKELAICSIFLEKKSFKQTAVEYHKRYCPESAINELQLIQKFDTILSRAISKLSFVLQQWQILDSLAPFLNNTSKRLIFRHPTALQLRIQLIQLYSSDQIISSDVMNLVSSLKNLLFGLEKPQSKNKAQPFSKVLLKKSRPEPIQEEQEQQESVNHNGRSLRKLINRVKPSKMVDQEYELQQIDMLRDHKGRFKTARQSKIAIGSFPSKNRPFMNGDDFGMKNRLRLTYH